MNQLSWLIYLADVVGNVIGLMTIALASLVVAAILSAIVLLLLDDSEEKSAAKARALCVKCAIWAVIVALVSIPIPSKETIYAIAASEAGEKLLNSPMADNAEQALNAWLGKQIADAAKKDSK